MSPLIFTLSISVHSMFIGLAIGVTDELSVLIGLFIGTLLHKWADAMGVGAALE